MNVAVVQTGSSTDIFLSIPIRKLTCYHTALSPFTRFRYLYSIPVAI